MLNYILYGIDDPRYPKRKLSDEHMFNPANFGLTNVIPLLVEGGVSINARSPVFNNPALWTSIKQLEDNRTALTLLELGADPNLQAQGMPTCLELAFGKQDWELIIALHKAGAKFPNGELEADIVETAILQDRADVVEYLLSEPKVGSKFLKEYPLVFLANYFNSFKVMGLLDKKGLSENGPNLESPTKLDNPLKFEKRGAKPYPRNVAKEYGDIDTRVTAVFDSKGRLVLPIFKPEVPFVVYQYLKSMLMDWQIEAPRINKKPAYIKVAFPINLEDPNESNDPDKGLLRINKFDKEYQDGMVLPKPNIRIAPLHPTELRKSDAIHLVTAEVVVNEKGRVVDLTLEKDTNKILAENTLKALKQWIFRPGYNNKKPVQMKLRYTFKFYPNGTINWQEHELVCADC